MPETPTCPACKAKFSHSTATLCCNKCGLPDEVRDAGTRQIKRWMRRRTTAEQVDVFPKKHSSNHNRKRNKHGRVGTKRA